MACKDNGSSELTGRLFAILDGLEEKRSARRLSAARDFLDLLQHHVLIEDLSTRAETVVEDVGRLLRRSGEEQELGARIMLCLAAQVEDPERLYERVAALAGKLARDVSAPPEARAAAIRAWGFWAFLAGEAPGDAVAVMDAVLELADDDLPSSAAAAGLSTWALLATLLSRGIVRAKIMSAMDTIRLLAAARDGAVLPAAAAALGVGLEAGEVDVSSVQDLVELTFEHDLSKKEREMSHAMGALRRLLQGYACETEKLTITGHTLQLTSLAQQQRMAHVRHAFGGGLPRQLAANPLLREVFGLGLPAQQPLSREDREDVRRTHRQDAKQRSRQRRQDRDRRSAADMVGAGDEEEED